MSYCWKENVSAVYNNIVVLVVSFFILFILVFPLSSESADGSNSWPYVVQEIWSRWVRTCGWTQPLLSDCFSADEWELAQLGTDIHSPIQSIERWLPLGHKSQPRLRVKALQWAISGASKQACVCVRERERWMNWQFAQMKLCKDNNKRPPKLFDMPNKLPFAIQSCRAGQCTIQYYYDFITIIAITGDIILRMCLYKHRWQLTSEQCYNPKVKHSLTTLKCALYL